MAKTKHRQVAHNFKDLTRQRFGRWKVLALAIPGSSGTSAKWRCRCDCDTIRNVCGAKLRAKDQSTSCGCYRDEAAKKRATKHNQSYSREYRIWINAKGRCTNPNYANYDRYGGRGITFCRRWFKFENFLKDMGRAPSIRHTLDRKKGKKGYCPSNCRWATPKEQARNKDSTPSLTFNGRTQKIVEWAEELNVPSNRIRTRLRLGWSAGMALLSPVGRQTRLSDEQLKQRRQAHKAVSTARRNGSIAAPIKCEYPGCNEPPALGHHINGYEKPHWLDVQWLCHKHHGIQHSKQDQTIWLPLFL